MRGTKEVCRFVLKAHSRLSVGGRANLYFCKKIK